MKNTLNCSLAAVLSATVLLWSGSRVGAQDWDTTVKYLKKYIEEGTVQDELNEMPDGKAKITVTADEKQGTITIVTLFRTETYFSRATDTIQLKLIDPNKLTIEEKQDFDIITRKVPKVYFLHFANDSEPVIARSIERKSAGRPTEFKDYLWKSHGFFFATEDTAKRALNALKRGIALAKEIDTADPFGEKPKPPEANPMQKTGQPDAGTSKCRSSTWTTNIQTTIEEASEGNSISKETKGDSHL
jgi:hypothetical protein